jgi:hypothetical protein
MRRCRHCGRIAGTDTAAEPICSHDGLVGAHSYEDAPDRRQPFSAISAVYKQAHICDQLAAKKIRDEYLRGEIGPNVATARLREVMRQGRLKVQA